MFLPRSTLPALHTRVFRSRRVVPPTIRGGGRTPCPRVSPSPRCGGAARGASLHWDGARWSVALIPGAMSLADVTGDPAGALWVVGGGERSPLISRWDGTRWSTAAAGLDGLERANLTAAWAGPDGAVWVVGKLPPVGVGERRPAPTQSVALRWDGARWTRIATERTGAFDDVWGVSATEVYVASGSSGLRWDGARWITVLEARAEDPPLARLWGIDGRHVWAVGNDTLRAWNGTTWTATTFSLPHTPIAAFWAADARHAWVFGSLGLIGRYSP